MRNLAAEKKMFQIAEELIETRYPKGWGGAAVIRTEKDHYFSSVAIETANSAASLCIEVGAMCGAHKYNEKVTHCLCIVREDENSPYRVLSPCGICQERLRYWGEDVQVGVTASNGEPLFVELIKLQPYHWTLAYDPEELEHFSEDD